MHATHAKEDRPWEKKKQVVDLKPTILKMVKNTYGLNTPFESQKLSD